MKKSIKILTLVLSLALICGALIVAAFAEGETEIVGVRLDNKADMEGIQELDSSFKTIKESYPYFPTAESNGKNQLATNADKDDGSLAIVQFKHQLGGQGKIVENPVDGNHYITVEYTEKFPEAGITIGSSTYTQSSGHMLDSYLSTSRWSLYTRDANGDFGAECFGTDNKYFIMDADLIWFDPANYDSTGSFCPYLGYTDAAGTGFKNIDGSIGLVFTKADGVVKVAIRGDDEKFVIGSDGTWSHVTYIMEPVVITDDNGNNLKFIQYLAIDGVIVAKHEWTNNKTVTDVYEGDRTLCYTRDIRLDVFGRLTKTNIPSSASVDNYSIRTILPEYNGNLANVLAGGVGADLTAWESNLYDADAMPYGKTVATNGETPYDSLQKAIDAAAEGDTITLCSNVTGTVTVGKDITINYGDYTMAAPATANKLVAVNDETNKAYTFEPADVEYVKGGVTYYALLSDSASFKTVITNADEDADVTDDVATIKLLKDVDLTLTGDISVSKNITIDLGGKTLYMRQHAQAGFAPGGSKNFKLMNGTIVASTGGDYDTTNKKAHAIVTNIGSKANVYFDDVDTYGYAITYSWGNAYNVYVDGGEHHVHSYGYTHMTYAGWICGNNDIIATVENADIYLDYSSGTLVGFQNYKSTATTPKSAATFDNCDIIGSSATHSIIAGLNKYSTVAFTNSNIYGKIAPGSTTNDGDNKNPVDGSITIGAGCKISGNVVGNSVVKWADGITPINVGDTETLTANKPSGYYSNGDFKITATTLYAEYSWCDKALLGELSTENNDSYFTITSGENTYYTDSLRQALTLAPAGSTVTLNKDYDETFAGSAGVITGGLTIDLNGHRLVITQSAYNAYITIATNDTVTIKNGVLVAAINNDFVTILANDGDSSWKNSDGTPKYTRALDAGLPVFVAYEGANGVTGLAVDLVVEGVNTYVSTIFHNESATGSKLTVKGGVHQSVAATLKLSINGTKTSALGNGGFFQSRTNMTAKFIDSDIYMNYCSSIFANSHKNVPSGTTAHTEVVYTDCSIIQSATDGKPLIMYSDSNTYAYFNGCGIFGHLLVPSKETGTAMGSGNIIFGEGTHHGYANTTKTLIEPTIVEGLTKFEFASTIKITDTVMAQTGGQFHNDSNNDGYSDGVSSFLKASAFSNSQTCNYAYGTPAFEIVKGGATIQRPNTNYYTFKEALADADEGSTITLLADAKVGTSKITINKTITIDLNGHVLDAFLPYHYESDQYYTASNNLTNSKITTFGLSEGKTVTFKGEKEGSGIISGSFDGMAARGTFITPGKNSTVNFKGANLKVSVPQLAATWGVTGWTVNIDGGYYCYDINNAQDGAAWIFANAKSTGVTVNIKNAVYGANIGGATGAAMTVNVENTVLLGTAYASGSPDATFNVSDSYIFNALEPNKVVLGANCYISVTSWLSASTTTFADGVSLVAGTYEFDHTNYTQKFAVITDENGMIVADPTSTVFTAVEVTRNYTYMTTADTSYTFIANGGDGKTYYSNDLSDLIAKVPTGTTVSLMDNSYEFAAGTIVQTAKGKEVTLSDAIMAQFDVEYVKGGVTCYVVLDDTDGFINIIKNEVDADSDVAGDDVATIKLLKDVYVHLTANLSVGKNLTIDLGGNTLYIEQDGYKNDAGNWNGSYSLTTSKSLKFLDGTVMLASSEQYELGKATAIVQPSSGANIYFKNVNTYGYALTYSWGNAYNVYVDGGEHHMNAKPGNFSYPGWICGGNNITAVVENATIYLEKTSSNLVMLSHYRASADNMSSTATFDKCTIVASSSTHNIIPQMNNNTKITFTECDIFGKIDPTAKPGQDNKSSVVAENGAIVIGPGCKISTNVLGSVVVFADGGKMYKNDVTETLSVNKANGLWNTEGFTLTSTTQDVTYNISDVTGVEGLDFAFSYIKDGVTYYGAVDSLEPVIEGAASGAIVTLLHNITIEPTGWIDINKGITIDLNEKTLTLVHSGQDKTFRILTTELVTFTSGNVVVTPKAGTTYGDNNTTYAFVFVGTNQADVRFDKVNGLVSALIYSWGSDYTVTVDGGTYTTNVGGSGMNTYGFICGQANITANVTGATIYIEYNGSRLLGASSYRQVHNLMNGKNTSIEDAKKGLSSEFTFTDCNIVAPTADYKLIYTANEYTKITFNGCKIFGSIETKANDSTVYFVYNEAGETYATSHYNDLACTCGNFTDVDKADGKCDTCGKHNPDYAYDTYKPGECPVTNITIQGGTLYTSASNLATNASRPEYVIEHTVSESIVIGGKLYTFDRMADYAYVIWYDENGNELEKQMIAENFTLEAPEYAAEGGTTNGWYKIGGYVANSWTDKLGGTVAVDLSKVDLANLTGNLEYYPQAADISAYLSAAMYNLSITGAIRNNLYIPETPENVEILGVFVGDREVTGTKVLFRDYNNAPVYYTFYVINEVGATEFTKTTTVTVKYTVDGTELTQLYSLSAESYANIIYNDKANGTGAYGEAAYNVVADLVRYSYLLSVYANVEDDNLTALYNKMSDMCSELPADNEMAGSTTNASEFAGLGSIQYEASSYEPRWKFNLNESAQIVDIKITLEGWNSGVYADRTNFGTQTYGIEGVVRSNGYITAAYTQNIPVYNMVYNFNITFVKADGSEASGTYSLKDYYTHNSKNAEVADFIKSVFALADSTIAYKFPEGKKTENDVADFWECDHEGVGEVKEVVSAKYVFKPRFCEKCDSWLFYYEDYGAVANGQTNHTRDFHITGTNDYEAIFWTHENANEWAQRSNLNLGKHTAVVGNSTPETDKNYYISLPEGTGVYASDIDRDGTPETTYVGENLGTIVIATDTSWNGVNLLIDDDVICNNYAANYDSADPNPPTSACECGRKHAYITQPIFTVDEYGAEDVIMDLKSKVTSLAAGATSIGYAPGRKMLIELRDYDKNIYFRYGSNANNGAAITEVILVDEFGNIDPSTPVQWDYVNLNDNKYDLVKAYAVDTDPIKISGLDANGEINAIFETYVNNSLDQYLYHYEACYRNITIMRSNATVEGIDRNFLEEPAKDTVTNGVLNNVNDRMAYTFINVQYCSNATVKDMLVINHNSQNGDTTTNQGSYEFSGGTANAVSWINCETKNMFSSGKDGSLQAYPVYRGLFGTNHIRNMYLEDCYLNSFDAHTGAYNVTIVNSTFDHMNFIGGGLIKLTDVTIYTAKSYGCAINLRTDYGSTWNGDIEIDGLTIKYGAGDKPSRISLLYGAYANQYWGFDTYTPQNVTINNFHVQQYTAQIVDGVRVESNIIKDASTMPVYYYYGASYEDGYGDKIAAGHMHTLTGVPAKSEAGEHGPEDKGDPNITYDYGTNHLEATKNLTISNSVSIILPTGDFWSEMNVTVNGVVYNYVPGWNATNGTWEEE